MSASAGVKAAIARGSDSAPRISWLLGGSALALAAMAWSPAMAATEVSGGSSGVATSTAASGAAADISQTGTLTVTSGAAITLDSDNAVTNSGTLKASDAGDATGVLVQGGHTGSVTNSGAITISQSTTLTSTDSNGVISGPFATVLNNYGVRLLGEGGLTGSIVNSGAITVQGNSSAGISLESSLDGELVDSGSISVSGAGSYGLHTTATVVGSLTLSGSVAAAGEGAQAIAIEGDVGGRVVIGGTVTATGYHTATRGGSSTILTDQDANDAAQGGPAVSVAGDLGYGLLVTAPPSTVSADVIDANGDAVADASETTATVTAYGSAPAIRIGAVGRDITLGAVGTDDSAYGVVIGGVVAGAGVRDGVSATGLQIGVDGGGAVNIEAGVRLRGSLTATAYDADATAAHILAGGSVPSFYNSGTLAAYMTGDTAHAARAIVVEAGGSLSTLLNAGTIDATVVGATGDATAIIDRSGTLSRLDNIGVISAVATLASGATGVASGKTVAIDVSTNTTGFSLTNYLPSGWSITPTITGSILMGSGNDSVDVEAGSIAGDLSFGAGANSLRIDGGATVAGGLTADGGTLALSVGTGALQINSTSLVNLTSLNLGSGAKLTFTADPAAGAATRLDVAGQASIASGAKLDVRLTSFASAAQTFTVIRADQLSVGDIDTTALGSAPYLYKTSVAADAAAGVVTLSLSRKTAAELALPAQLAGGYEPVVAQAQTSSGLSQGLLAQTDRASFIAAYNQLLPEHSGGVFRMAAAGVEAFGRPIDDRRGDAGGSWLQEVNDFAIAKEQGDMLGFRSWSVGLAGGYELPATDLGTFGLTLGALSAEMRPHETASTNQVTTNLVEGGGYWRTALGPFAASARFGAEYLQATSRRAVSLTSGDETYYTGTASGHWNGWGLTSRARISYEARWRSLYLRPQLGLDYLKLDEDGYQEGGDAALDLTVAARKTSELTGFAGVAFGAVFGDEGDAYWAPELLLGYRDVLSAHGGTTTAAFASGGDSFTVGALPYAERGAVARIAVRNGSGPAAITFEGGAEIRDGLTVFDAKLGGHIRF